MKFSHAVLVLFAFGVGCADKRGAPSPKPNGSSTTPPVSELVVMDQGAEWTSESRAAYYRQDQGSRLIPLSWLKALKQPDGTPFISDHLSRYGYLSNIEEPRSELPVGFSVSGPSGSEVVGMTCSACHTRQIDVGDTSYRIDGGPAVADFQSFVAALDTAVKEVIEVPKAFQDFAHAVLPQPATPDAESRLKDELTAWYLPYHTIMSRSLPPDPWGPSRLDALGMIFNRLTGLDIGTEPDHLIPENIQVADAPARYPFLWNAAIQDKTQWPGIADNGNDLLGLARNLGEVYGVFATFHPKKAPLIPIFQVDYIKENSADFSGLEKLEDLIKKIGPPKYPWPIDAELANEGAAIFARDSDDVGCAKCHGIEPGKTRFLDNKTWKTPIQDVGTDSREYQLLGRTAQSGVLEGARLPFGPSMKPVEQAATLLRTVVLGTIMQSPFKQDRGGLEGVEGGLEAVAENEEAIPESMKSDLNQLNGYFQSAASEMDPDSPGGLESVETPPTFAYESRVLQGIWAAAPYLHNGSVPTLEALLEPVDRRPKSFMVGPEYDPAAVGLAKTQKKFQFTLHTTDASDRNSGNSRCGHEFGTNLSRREKRALLEYLKTL